MTTEETETPNQAHAAVSSVLFRHEIDDKASYYDHKDDFLVIEFVD
jgi:hypothetical protein